MIFIPFHNGPINLTLVTHVDIANKGIVYFLNRATVKPRTLDEFKDLCQHIGMASKLTGTLLLLTDRMINLEHVCRVSDGGKRMHFANGNDTEIIGDENILAVQESLNGLMQQAYVQRAQDMGLVIPRGGIIG